MMLALGGFIGFILGAVFEHYRAKREDMPRHMPRHIHRKEGESVEAYTARCFNEHYKDLPTEYSSLFKE